ncbi:MAG: hypothetical protein EA412_04970 [Chitinophagaceae bacterium]|nr:MAG: hypothetical protein EA412_04970 [Chitinophagaceae bacterium]
MKNPSLDLYYLVKSLSPQDKVNFKVFTKKNSRSTDQVYLRLFDLISLMKEYDEHKLLSKFGDRKDKKWLTTAKVRLYKMILKSLNAFASDSEIEIAQHLQSSRILFKKGLYKQAYTILLKAKKKAIKGEKFEVLPGIYETERLLIGKLFYKEKRLLQHKKVASDYKKALGHLDELAQSKSAMHFSISYGSIQGIARTGTEIEQLKDQLILPASEEPVSNRAKIYFYAAYSNFYRFSGNIEKSYEYSRKTVLAIESRRDLIEENIRMYIASLHNHVLLLQELKNFSEVSATLNKLYNIIPGLADLKSHLQNKLNAEMTESEIAATNESIFMVETNQYILTGEFAEGVKKIDKINEVMEKQSHLLIGNKTVSCIIHYNFAYLYFGAERYEDAIFWLNKVLNEEHEYLQEDLHALTKVVNLIFHYEIGNENLLDYFVRSTYRFLYKRKRLYELEGTILTFIRKKIPFLQNQKEIKEQFKILKKELESLSKDSYQQRVMEHFDFISWLESKITGRKFAAVFKENNLKK